MSLNFCLLLILSCAPGAWAAPWSHLELGAANYGAEVPAQVRPGDPRAIAPEQLDVLEQTVEDLIREHGPLGEFYVNDLNPRKTHYAAERLRRYLEFHGHDEVGVVEWAGNYTTMPLPHVGSADLKNPDWDVLMIPGLGAKLRRIAERSETGLRIITNMESLLRARLARDGHDLGDRIGTADAYVHPSGEVEEEFPGIFVLGPAGACTAEFERAGDASTEPVEFAFER